MALDKKLSSFLPQTLATNKFVGKSSASNIHRQDNNHLFANNVRFLSMAAIIGIHTLENYPGAVMLTSIPPKFLYLLQPLKFGTIGFFLVSGFLFGERIEKHSSFEYFKRRLRGSFGFRFTSV